MTKKWKTISSNLAYECKYLKIWDEDFSGTSGKVYKYYILDRKDYVIVIAKDKKYFYLIEQGRYTVKGKLLQVVAGAIEEGETPLFAARKELKEEAGIVAKKIKKLGWFYAYYGCSKQKAYVFLAEYPEFGKQELEGLEKEGGVEVKKMTISEIKKCIRTGKIKDADTLSAFNIFMLKCNNKPDRSINKLN